MQESRAPVEMSKGGCGSPQSGVNTLQTVAKISWSGKDFLKPVY